MNESDLDLAAENLYFAAKDAAPIKQLSSKYSGITVSDAYRIQRDVFGRLHDSEAVTGYKLGLTSKAKMEQVKVSEPILGRLSRSMETPDGGELSLEGKIHPRIEPEVALRVKIAPEGLKVTELAPALEILDSRYEGFKFNLVDVIADNSSASGFVCGNWLPPGIDLSNLGVVLSVDGRVAGAASLGAILGNCMRTLPLANRILREHSMLSGQDQETILLVGSPMEAVDLKPGTHVKAEIESIGGVSVSVRKGSR